MCQETYKWLIMLTLSKHYLLSDLVSFSKSGFESGIRVSSLTCKGVPLNERLSLSNNFLVAEIAMTSFRCVFHHLLI